MCVLSARAEPPAPPDRVEALRAALDAHDDVEVLRGLCEGGGVPEELRADLWKVRQWRREGVTECSTSSPLPPGRSVLACHGGRMLWVAGLAHWTVRTRQPSMSRVSNRQVSAPRPCPHPLTPSAPHPLTPSALHYSSPFSPIAKLGLEPEAEREVAMEMELVISYYCKSRNLRFSPECGWPELLLPLASLRLPRAELFNCFYAILAKYIPK